MAERKIPVRELPDGTKMLPRDFSKVVLTKDTSLIPPSRLHPTPSSQDGLSWDYEVSLRILGCEYIQSTGNLLKVPQVAMATGQVLFQRFYYIKSFVKHNMEIMAMACIYLASKIEECPRRPRDVIMVFHHVKQVRNKKTIITTMTLDQNYMNIKNQVIKAERRILKELGFCVHIKHPHKMIVLYLKFLELLDKQTLVQTAWNHMNDIFRTDVFVRYAPETIAAGCIQMAARSLKVPLPNRPHWYYVFDIRDDEIMDICNILLHLYNRPKPHYDVIGQEVDRLKKLWLESKGRPKAEVNADEGTNAASQPVTPKASPTPTQTSSRRVKEDDHCSEMGSEKNHHVSRKRHRSDESDGSHSGRSRSRSRSRSSRSRSGSLNGKKRHRSPYKYRKDHRRSPDRYSASNKDRRAHKRKHRSRSFSRSPDRYSKSHKKNYKEKDYDRKDYDRKDYDRKDYDRKDYDRNDRYYSPDRHRSSRKHRNGHRTSPRDRYRR